MGGKIVEVMLNLRYNSKRSVFAQDKRPWAESW